MTDLAFIVDTSDAALPAGRAAAPVSTDSTGADSFSGLLGERLQSGLARRSQASDSPPQMVASDANVASESGVSEPADGKPLPLLSSDGEVSSQNLPQAGQARAALLAAMSQSESGALVALDSSAIETESDVGLSHLSTLQGGLVPGSLQNTLGDAVLVARAEAQSTQAIATPSGTQLPVTNLANQLMSAKSNGLPADKQDAQAGRMQTANITSALLAQPISESAQRALVMAMNEAGQGKQIAPSIAGQIDASKTLNSQQSGLSPLPDSLTAAMRLAAMGKTTANTNFLASVVDTRLAQSSSPSLTSVNPLTMTNNAEDVSGMLSVGSRVSSTAGAGFMPTMSVATPVGQPGWANEMGQRVAWLAQGELREAQLQLHPRNLGPVEVRIAYGHEQQLNVSFTAANPLAREALDAALPRLREMFEQQGLNLADADISQHSFAEQHNQESDEGGSDPSSDRWSVDSEELTEQAVLSNHVLTGNGMLDAYA